ncbi:SpoIIE family protein phosphatase [soil metagenome]
MTSSEPGSSSGHAPMRDVLERAVIATDISLTISDPSQPDNPLVLASPAFARMTGYELAEIAGRNCRFLQGEGTQPETRQRMRDAVARREPVTVTVLNYRRDGSAFWNEVAISPVLDEDGKLTHFVGVQTDVTARVLLEQGRERAYAAERSARADAEGARAAAEAAQAQTGLLVDATTLLVATLDLDEALQRLVEVVVPVLADWCLVHLAEPAEGPLRTFAAHVDDTAAALLRARIEAAGGRPSAAMASAMAGNDSELVREVSATQAARLVPGEHSAGVDAGSAIVVPLRARRQTMGALTLVRGSSRQPYGQPELSLARDLARRAALTVDNARLYTHERHIAETLQRSLLPEVDAVEGAEVAARYLPGSSGVDVGGDWYDILQLADGAIGVTIGDVMGHDMRAAAAMGQLRHMLRGYAWEGGDPAEVLDRVDRLVRGLAITELATALCARIERTEGGAILRYASAGHLPPVLRSADGSVRLLEDGQSLLLGLDELEPRTDASESLHPGDTLLLYTDGLVERRDAGLDAGLARLVAAVDAAPVSARPEELCDAIVAAMTDGPLSDDVALVALRIDEL